MNAEAMPALDAKAADRLVKLLGMLGSDHGGERAAAAAMADRLVRERGLTWGTVITPAPPADNTEAGWWRRLVAECRARPAGLYPKEHDFLASMDRCTRAGRLPTPKQQAWLLKIRERRA